jgi:exonuclease VII small subunit
MSSVGEIASSTTEMIATTEHKAAQANLETQSSVHRLQAEDSNEYFRDAVAIIREAQSTLQAFYSGVSEAKSEIIQNARM